ncbi:MAG: 3-deoxy-D-manno-octulosonic acid transferase [Bacteroidales bacterium]|nr:3-deoxy-D-manno-octulosonic acid transferase [Bacteroidales bacterium]
MPRIEATCGHEQGIIWFHVASFGEFEEARPVIEATRTRFPGRKILLTVFSPSVYEPMKDYDQVDWVFYLPLDTPGHARRFLDAVRPAKAIFNIGEHWPFLLEELRRRGIETYIMSVRMEPDSPYLKWYGIIQRRILQRCYRCVMVQNEESQRLLTQMGVPEVKAVGDARMDRVLTVCSQPWSDPVVDVWCDGMKVFVAGSTYAVEDRMLLDIANTHPECKILIIPHELDRAEVDMIVSEAQHGAVRYTDYAGKRADDALLGAQILVIDTVGMLSRLYRYGFAAYVGGAFSGPMPHSVVEPAAYGIPVAFGPRYDRELHCKDLVSLDAGFPVANTQELEFFYEKSLGDRRFLERSGKAASEYCRRSAGATEAIMQVIFG